MPLNFGKPIGTDGTAGATAAGPYSDNPPFFDVMNAGEAPGTGTATAPTFNMDEWTKEEFKTSKLDLNLPLAETIPTCWDECKEQHRLREEKCTEVRKRVELALKTAGCPTKVVAIKQKMPSCGGSRRKKSTTTTRRPTTRATATTRSRR